MQKIRAASRSASCADGYFGISRSTCLINAVTRQMPVVLSRPNAGDI